MAYGHSFGLPPEEAPFAIAEKSFFPSSTQSSCLVAQELNCYTRDALNKPVWRELICIACT